MARRTWRDVDGVRIEGVTRHAFIRNGGTYFLTDLAVYADGMVDCWGLMTVEGFAAKLESGWVATTFEEGARASVYDVATWKFTEPRAWVTAEMLLGAIRDDIDRLNKRPDSVRRARMVLEEFRRDQSEENRAALLAAYLAIPEHRRRSALGDMDVKDRPLKVLAYGIGARLRGDDGPVITEEDHRWALEYFAERKQAAAARSARTEPDGAPREVSTLDLVPKLHAQDWPDPPGVMALRNEYPAPITIGGVVFPTVEHAYWALSTGDETQRAVIAAAATPLEAATAGQAAPRRAGWEQVCSAVMAALLRAKFSQHPELARILAGTGTAVITYNQIDSEFWGHRRNWMGRLLELIRAELALQNLGLIDPR
jgi:predicted NAD-dependent protein-ADP-ribosyltransferase YbiA (DUF1768 family)